MTPATNNSSDLKQTDKLIFDCYSYFSYLIFLFSLLLSDSATDSSIST